jgi:hypothetical protein
VYSRLLHSNELLQTFLYLFRNDTQKIKEKTENILFQVAMSVNRLRSATNCTDMGMKVVGAFPDFGFCYTLDHIENQVIS